MGEHTRPISRRWTIRALFGALAWPRVALGEESTVPVDTQAELMSKVARYDRNFAARAGERAKVLVCAKANGADSARTSGRMALALGALSDLGGLPVSVSTVSFSDAASLRTKVDQEKISILYLCDELSDQIPALASALTGANILTVGAWSSYVPAGVVLGFDLVSGKPKLLVNLSQARKQNVDFKAELLKLAKVFE